jgi:hypothetical protein
MLFYLAEAPFRTVHEMPRFADFRNRYVEECKASALAFVLGFALLVPVLVWQYEIYFAFALPVALIFAVPNIVLFSAVIALGDSIALRVGTLAVAIGLNFYILREALLNRIEHYDAAGNILAANYNSFPVIFWQMFLSFAVFYALLSYRRLAEWRAHSAHDARPGL